MIELELIAVELEEAGRLIGIGRVPQLRIAYLLIDNSIELMMERSIKNETMLPSVYAVMLRQMLNMEDVHGDNPDFVQQLEEIRSHVIPEKHLEHVDDQFPPKVTFLVR